MFQTVDSCGVVFNLFGRPEITHKTHSQFVPCACPLRSFRRIMTLGGIGSNTAQKTPGRPTVDGADSAPFTNGKRRVCKFAHPNASQRAAVAAKMANLEVGDAHRPDKVCKFADLPAPVTQAQAAKLMNVSTASADFCGTAPPSKKPPGEGRRAAQKRPAMQTAAGAPGIFERRRTRRRVGETNHKTRRAKFNPVRTRNSDSTRLARRSGSASRGAWRILRSMGSGRRFSWAWGGFLPWSVRVFGIHRFDDLFAGHPPAPVQFFRNPLDAP